MGKLLKYAAGGMLLGYFALGGCDSNIRDVFQEKYSEPVILARKYCFRLALRNSYKIYKSIESGLEQIISQQLSS